MMVRRAEKAPFLKKTSLGKNKRTRARRARDGTRSRSAGSGENHNTIRPDRAPEVRRTFTPRRSRVLGARRGVVLWTRVAFGDTIERARRQVTAAAPRDARAPRIAEPRGASPGSSRTRDSAHRSSRRTRRGDRRTARRHGRVSRSAGRPHESTKKSRRALFTPAAAAFFS